MPDIDCAILDRHEHLGSNADGDMKLLGGMTDRWRVCRYAVDVHALVKILILELIGKIMIEATRGSSSLTEVMLSVGGKAERR